MQGSIGVRSISSSKIVEVIEVMVTKGKGTDESPVKRVCQHWTKEGKLLYEFDCDTFLNSPK